MNGPHQMMNGWGGGFGIAFMIFFWVLISALIVVFIWFLVQKGSDKKRDFDIESPLEIIQKRYARGEIDEEEYRRMKKEILG